MRMKLYKILQSIIFFFSVTDKYRIVFESEGDYCDNARALFEYMIDNNMNEKYSIIWIVKNITKYKNLNYKNVTFIERNNNNLISSIICFFKVSRAKYYFFTHPYWLKWHRKNQIVINLWHGTPIKSGGKDISDCFDYVICPSEKICDNYKKFMGTKDNQFIFLGSPRNDLLFQNRNEIKKIIKNSKPEKTIVVLPTYKQSEIHNDIKKINKYVLPFIDEMDDLIYLNDELKNLKVKIIIKIHHLQSQGTYIKINLSNIYFIDDSDLENMNINLHNLIGETDAMITDFSSIIFDYCLCDKPIGFLTSEAEEYSKKRGFLVEDINSILVGDRINNMKDFTNFCNNIKKGKDNYKIERNKIKRIYNKYTDNKNCERIIEYLNLK